MSKQRIAVTWQMCGYIGVEADNIEEAMRKVNDNPDDYNLPYDGGNYVDGSFELTTNDVDEMKAMCKGKVKNIIVPVDVCIKRYYRAYAHVNEDATDEEIRKITMENIIENQDEELNADPDLGIEKDDIQYVNIDREGSWSEQDDKEIEEFLNRWGT